MAYQTSSLNPDQSVSPTALPALSLLLLPDPPSLLPQRGWLRPGPHMGTERHFPGIHPERPPSQGLPPAGLSPLQLAPFGRPDPEPGLSLLAGVELEARGGAFHLAEQLAGLPSHNSSLPCLGTVPRRAAKSKPKFHGVPSCWTRMRSRRRQGWNTSGHKACWPPTPTGNRKTERNHNSTAKSHTCEASE